MKAIAKTNTGGGTAASEAVKGPPKLRVGFVLAQRVTLTAFAGFVDALRLAADEGDRSRPLECYLACVSWFHRRISRPSSRRFAWFRTACSSLNAAGSKCR